MAEHFSERDLRNLLDRVQQAALKGYPNPERTGCPGTEVLQEIARTRAPFMHPAYQHVKTCSPCLQEMLDCQHKVIQSQKAKSKKQKTFVFAGAALVGAAVCLWIASDRVFAPKHNANAEIRRRDDRVLSPGSESPAPPQQSQAGSVPAIIALDFRSLAPRRSPKADRKEQVWHIPRALVTLQITLPFGSDDGNYAIEIRDEQPKRPALKSAVGIAQILDGNTLLNVSRLDLSAIPPGRYVFLFRHMDADWHSAVIAVP